ncbi:hypothetical protein ACJQWK_10670 [Exserohilum turcicum]
MNLPQNLTGPYYPSQSQTHSLLQKFPLQKALNLLHGFSHSIEFTRSSLDFSESTKPPPPPGRQDDSAPDPLGTYQVPGASFCQSLHNSAQTHPWMPEAVTEAEEPLPCHLLVSRIPEYRAIPVTGNATKV